MYKDMASFKNIICYMCIEDIYAFCKVSVAKANI